MVTWQGNPWDSRRFRPMSQCSNGSPETFLLKCQSAKIAQRPVGFLLVQASEPQP
jgi:hypothetical protein